MDFATYIKTKYDWLTPKDVSLIINKAKMFYYGLRYPYKNIIAEEQVPIYGFFEENWILSACDEIIERLGFNSAVGYKENGVSWSFDGAQLSNKLCSLVTPISSVII
jgi:hypothetical protein